MEEHPDVKLPRSVKGIVELTGLTTDQVKVFLSHERKKLRIALSAVPDLRGRGLVFEDEDGDRFFLTTQSEYRFAVDHWSLNVYIIIDGKKCSIKDIENFLRRIS